MSLPRFRLVQGKALGERSTPSGPPLQQDMQQQHQQQIKQEMEGVEMSSQEQNIKQEDSISPPRPMMGGPSHQMMPQRPQMMQNPNVKQEDAMSPPRPMMGGPSHQMMAPPQRGAPMQQPQHHYQQQPQQHLQNQNPSQHPIQNQNPPPQQPQHLQSLQNPGGPSGGPPGGPQQQQNEDKNVQKCVRFLKTLISLSQNEDVDMPDKAARVRSLIQGVIYMETTAEEFTRDLQQVLKSQAQPHLLPFLQNTLPALRNAVRNGTANVEGVNPPPGYVFNNGRHPNGASQGAPAPPQHMTPQQIPPPQQQIINRLNSDSTPQAPPPPRHLPQNTNFQPRGGPPPLQTTPVVRTISGGPQNLQAPPTSASSQQIQNQMLPRTPQQQQPPQPMEVDEPTPLAPPPVPQQQPRVTSNNLKSAILKHDEILNRITKRMLAPCSVEEDALIAISDAVESHLREMIAMMAGYAEHRVESMRVPDNYAPVDDVKRQLRFLEDVDRQEEEMRENREKESLIRMSKNKNIGKETIEKAKEMQRADAEAKRNRDANAAAIAALSSNRNVKSKWEGAASASTAPRPRTVRVTTRDLHLLVNQDQRFTGTFIREKLSYGGPAIDTTI